MKRSICALLILLILLTALLPSAFCVAEPENVARYEEILNTLSTYTNYASPQVLALVEEAEDLLSDPDVQAAYTEEELALVAFYRHGFHVDCVLEEINAKVKLYRYVRYSTADEREYGEREWATIYEAYLSAAQDIDAATVPEDMEAVRDAFFESIHALPVYADIYNGWEPVINEVINAEVARLETKVNDYRASVGLSAVAAPTFIVVTFQNCVDDVAEFARANLEDAESVVSTFTNAATDAKLLGMYASKSEMEGVWDSYRYAVNMSKGRASAEEISLNNKKKEAVATLTQAIVDSSYIQSLKGEDYALYQAFPAMMREQLASVQTEEEVAAVLDDYLALLEPSALHTTDKKLDTLTVLIIVFAVVAVLLFATYLVMRFRKGSTPKKEDRKGAEQMLEELRRMSAEASKQSEGTELDGQPEEDAPASPQEKPAVEPKETDVIIRAETQADKVGDEQSVAPAQSVEASTVDEGSANNAGPDGEHKSDGEDAE